MRPVDRLVYGGQFEERDRIAHDHTQVWVVLFGGLDGHRNDAVFDPIDLKDSADLDLLEARAPVKGRPVERRHSGSIA